MNVKRIAIRHPRKDGRKCTAVKVEFTAGKDVDGKTVHRATVTDINGSFEVHCAPYENKAMVEFLSDRLMEVAMSAITLNRNGYEFPKL